MDELVDIVDEDGRILRQATKVQAHRDGLLHKTTIGYIRQGNNWVLVRQTSDRQDAGQLVAPVGGHVQAGESELDALRREAVEEIGAKVATHSLVGRARFFHRHVIGRDENHLFVVYEITVDGDLVLGAEADSVAAFTSEELKQALRETPQDFGDGLYFVFEHFYSSYLPEEYAYRWNIPDNGFISAG